MQKPQYLKLRPGDEVITMSPLLDDPLTLTKFLVVTKKGFLYRVLYKGGDYYIAEAIWTDQDAD